MNMNLIETIRSVANDGSSLVSAEVYSDEDLAGQCVGICFVFTEKTVFVYPEGADDSIRVSSAPPAMFSDVSVRKNPAPAGWASAVGCPILWAWVMMNMQGTIDGVQMEFGTVGHCSIKLQILVRASTLVLRTL